MPFRRIFKKTRRYDVSSKNEFLVGVHMLDNSFLEIMLGPNSLGKECLNSIMQKYEISEVDGVQYFGLRYVTKKLQFRWVDLDRPLKKQLDKYAQSPRLHFGVMYYIPRAHTIADDNARYQYFLQLKTDIIDGRLPCTLHQAKRFAAFSLQAEFGDHIPGQHVPEALLQYPMLPTIFTKDEATLHEIIVNVLVIHQTLVGVHPLTAEIQYIKEVQRLDGYGLEYYVAKDSKSKELYLGTSFAGISTTYLDGQTTNTTPWCQITSVNHSKRVVSVGSTSTNKPSQYQLEDSDQAKYMCAMCLLLQNFYVSHKIPLSATNSNESSDFELTSSQHAELPDIQLSAQTSRDLPDVTDSHSSVYYNTEDSLSGSGDFKHGASSEYLTSQHSLDVLPVDVCSTIPDQQTQPTLVHTPPQQTTQNVDITTQYQIQQQHNLDNLRRQAMLPAYRPSPDYESVMQQRMIQVNQGVDYNMTSFANVGQSNVYTFSDTIAYSQPEIYSSQPMDYNYNNGGIYANINADYIHYNDQNQIHTTYSTPDLYSQIEHHSNQYLSSNYNHIDPPYYTKPPPPYPRTSNSTPDLASNPRTTITNSPDLVSRRNLGLHQTLTAGNPPQTDTTEIVNSDVMVVTVEHNTSKSVPASFKLGVSDVHVDNCDVNMEDCRNDTESSKERSDKYSDNSENVTRDNENKENNDENNTIVSRHCVTNSEKESDEKDSPDRDGNITPPKEAVQIKYIAPSDAPPQTKSANIAIRRESFRRQMIANVPHMEPRVKDREPSTLPPISDVQSPTIDDVPPELPPKERRRTSCDSGSSSPSTSQQSTPSRHSPKKSPSKSNLSPSKLLITDIDNDTYADEMRDIVLERRDIAPEIPPKSPFGRSISLRGQERRYQTNDPRSSTRSNVSQNDRVRALRRSPNSGQLRTSQGSDSLSPNAPSSPLSQGSQRVSESSATESCMSSEQDADVTAQMFANISLQSDRDDELSFKRLSMGPLRVAALNGLNFSSPSIREALTDDTRAPKDDRRKTLENRLADGVIFGEFEEVPRKITDLDIITGSLPENICRNRFRDVLPYEFNRVKLTPRYDNDTGYINASHIKVSHGGEQWWFIASQAPMDISVEDFWQMVWEYNVHVVAMLTDIVETSKRKCTQYWPEETGEENCLELENFDIVLKYRTDSLCYVTNTIIIRYKPLNKERQIWHLQYTAWPDHGCPDDIFGFLGFLDEVDSVQRLAESESDSTKKFPIVVHCTAGVGRTGVMILTEIMKSCLELNQSIDLPKALNVLRQQRMFMVQTVGQYSFVYRTLVQYLKNTRLI